MQAYTDIASSEEEEGVLFCLRVFVRLFTKAVWRFWTDKRYSCLFLPIVVRLRLALLRLGVGSLWVDRTGVVGVPTGTHREAWAGWSLVVWVRLVTESHTADAVSVSTNRGSLLSPRE